MKPMGINSTQFISYHEIDVEGIDLHDDAFGFYPEFREVFDLLNESDIIPEESLIGRLIEKIRREGNKDSEF